MFLNFLILLLLFIILEYNIFKSVMIILLSCNFTMGRRLGGITGRYFMANQDGFVLVSKKLLNNFKRFIYIVLFFNKVSLFLSSKILVI